MEKMEKSIKFLVGLAIIAAALVYLNKSYAEDAQANKSADTPSVTGVWETTTGYSYIVESYDRGQQDTSTPATHSSVHHEDVELVQGRASMIFDLVEHEDGLVVGSVQWTPIDMEGTDLEPHTEPLLGTTRDGHLVLSEHSDHKPFMLFHLYFEGERLIGHAQPNGEGPMIAFRLEMDRVGPEKGLGVLLLPTNSAP